MHITKIGHCCLVIKVDGVTIMTDPGAYSEEQASVMGIDIILITHEHQDHLHVESLKEVLKNNPQAEVITNAGVGAKLDEAGITYTLLQGRDSAAPHGIQLEAFDARHEEIYEDFGQVQNTGYFIAEKLFYPGDAFKDPERPVDILALEGALKLKEISYIHAEGYPAAEMKHGPIALIDSGVPVICIATEGRLKEKMLSNMQEIKARRGRVIAITTEGDPSSREITEEIIEIPKTDELFAPFVATVPLQLLAYQVALLRGCNVDKPRNLAKSVTVE